jgi:hypothetical protein
MPCESYFLKADIDFAIGRSYFFTLRAVGEDSVSRDGKYVYFRFSRCIRIRIRISYSLGMRIFFVSGRYFH